MPKRLCFLAVFLAMALALCVSAAGATDAPQVAQPTVKLWAFYDKDVNAYPTGWWYLDPVITDPSAWEQDSPWLPFPSPHYALYGGTWGSETMGALIQEGDFGPGVAEIPLADGLYWVVLSAPPGNWQLTTDAVQKVYVWNGNVYVQWANEGLWYGDKVLVGIIDGHVAPAVLDVVWIDTYEEPNDGAAGPYSTSINMEAGRAYLVTISGTWSAWWPDDWDVDACGAPEPWPMFPSSGTDNGWVGLDSYWGFAQVADGCDGWVMGAESMLDLSLDGGSNYAPMVPQNPAYNPAHSYQFLVIGQGLPALLQLPDWTPDNYGVLKAVIQAAN